MTIFSQFAISLGASLALQAVIVGWIFRTTSAPTWHKLAVPALAVALACWTPYSASQMMGYPVSVSQVDLPAHAELLAFAPHDDDGTVDLWLRSGGESLARAYETKLTAGMKKTLREAREAMEHGARAVLTHGKPGRKGAADPNAIGDDDTNWSLDADALGALPPK